MIGTLSYDSGAFSPKQLHTLLCADGDASPMPWRLVPNVAPVNRQILTNVLPDAANCLSVERTTYMVIVCCCNRTISSTASSLLVFVSYWAPCPFLNGIVAFEPGGFPWPDDTGTLTTEKSDRHCLAKFKRSWNGMSPWTHVHSQARELGRAGSPLHSAT